MIRILELVALAALMTWALPARAALGSDKPPATQAAQKVMDTIKLIESKLTATKYQHKTVVKLKKGKFFWDCSGMADWVLQKAAPKARKALPEGRPLAKHFYQVIAKSPTDGQKKGWLRLAGPEQIRPGDVFSWLKPPFWKKRKNTGHVGFIVEAPRPHPSFQNVWLMKVADATRYLHEGDTRPPDGTGGYGTGTMAFLFDGDGTALAYGWYGSAQSPQTYVPTRITFGRVIK